MEELVRVDGDNQTVSARELHEKLGINSNFTTWFNRMIEYGFTEGADFFPKMEESTGGRPSTDYNIGIDMAKQICMIQRTAKGKMIRQYFIDLEKAWNTPEQILARALRIADRTIDNLRIECNQLTLENKEMKPKAIFADSVMNTDGLILIRDLAKLLRQNGIDTGEKRLYSWLRDKEYICKKSTMPTQKAVDMGLFQIVEGTTINKKTGTEILTKTTKVTGKGQMYFINKITEGC